MNRTKTRKSGKNDLFDLYLKSRPGPTVDQLVELSVRAPESLKRRAFDALLERKDVTPSILFSSRYGDALFVMYSGLLWGYFRNMEDLEEVEFLAIARRCARNKTIAMEIATEYIRRFGELSSTMMRALAAVDKRSRVSYWKEMVGRDLVNPSIVAEFVHYPETEVHAGKWMLDYQKRYPNGRSLHRSKEGPLMLMSESPIEKKQMLPLLGIPALRAAAAKRLMKMEGHLDVSAYHLASYAQEAMGTNASSSERRGVASVIKLLFQRARSDPKALTALLELPISARARKRASRLLVQGLEHWLRSDELYITDLKAIGRKADPSYQERLRSIIKTYRRQLFRSKQKTATQRLFDQLLAF